MGLLLNPLFSTEKENKAFYSAKALVTRITLKTKQKLYVYIIKKQTKTNLKLNENKNRQACEIVPCSDWIMQF